MSSQDVQTPELLDLTIDNITPNTIKINNQTKDARLKYLMERLVTHLHDFARETRLSTEEWMTALTFLISCGQICSDVRNVSLLEGFSCPWIVQSPNMLRREKDQTDKTTPPALRNSSSSPTCLASPSWSTTSTTPSRPTPPRVPCSGRSIRTMRPLSPTARA